jgi:hypothetical protein
VPVIEFDESLGMWVNLDTGEIIDIETPAGPDQPFIPQTEQEVEWVLGKMATAEALLLSIRTRPEVLQAKAVLANAAKMEKEAARKLDWLHARFDPDLGEFARKQLEGKKTKTWKSVLGSIALRIQKGRVKVENPELALEWAKAYDPDAIKTTEEFQISRATKLEEDNLPVGFIKTADEEKVTVKTGVAGTE